MDAFARVSGAPDPNLELTREDMNSWSPVSTGQLQTLINGKFVIYRTMFTLFSSDPDTDGRLIMRNVTGKAEIWLDKQLISSKNDRLLLMWS